MSEKHVPASSYKIPTLRRIKPLVLGVAAFAFLIAFSFWAGVPSGERALSFWIGVELLTILILAFSWIAWQLLFRPLPASQTIQQQPIKAIYRQTLSLLLSVGGFAFIVGAFWDELWHRQYGTPFGEDFFWRPHLLLYFSITVAAALGFAGLLIIVRWGQGTFQQRFRANPVIGLLILVGGFLVCVLPADPIWHAIYGSDLSAWSIPHLLLVVSFVSILLLAIAIYMTTQPLREWGAPRQLKLSDLQPLLLFAATLLSWNQFFTTEWDGGARFVLARPEWLLPVVIVSGAAFIGVMANHTLRVFGASTLSGVLALALRFALIRLFHTQAVMQIHPWVLMLPALVFIDMWCAYRPGAWIGAGGAAAVGMGVVLLTIFHQFYPLYPITNLPLAFCMLLVGGLGMSWLGAAIGDYFAAGNKDAAASSRLPLASLGVAGATVAFIIFFVTTATPPS